MLIFREKTSAHQNWIYVCACIVDLPWNPEKKMLTIKQSLSFTNSLLEQSSPLHLLRTLLVYIAFRVWLFKFFQVVFQGNVKQNWWREGERAGESSAGLSEQGKLCLSWPRPACALLPTLSSPVQRRTDYNNAPWCQAKMDHDELVNYDPTLRDRGLWV